jgi:hypothetical protein
MNPMIKFTLCYMRYALVALTTVAFHDDRN